MYRFQILRYDSAKSERNAHTQKEYLAAQTTVFFFCFFFWFFFFFCFCFLFCFVLFFFFLFFFFVVVVVFFLAIKQKTMQNFEFIRPFIHIKLFYHRQYIFKDAFCFVLQ